MRPSVYERLERDRLEARHTALAAEQKARALARLRNEHAALRLAHALIRLQRVLARKYRPDQPRVPAGEPGAGQWTNDGSNVGDPSSSANHQRIRLAGDITGFKKHGINQAINRGVSPSAIHDAVTNPLKLRPRPNGTTQYIGRDATVVLNPAGEVVTVWPR